MNDIIDFFATHSVDITHFKEYWLVAISNSALWVEMFFIATDILTGIGATFIQGKGLDSSIAFAGWIKHSIIIIVSLLGNFMGAALGIPVAGVLISIIGISVYFSSIPGNLDAMGIKLPNWILTVFKAEIERKRNIYDQK